MDRDRRRLPALESLRALEACVRHRSFTRAADELCISSAAVSLRIRELESELGVTLFSRSGPRVTPTPAGEALAAQVTDVLNLLRRAVDDCSSAGQALRLTVVPTFAMRWLAPRLARYEKSPGAVPAILDVSAELRPNDSFDIAVRTGLGDWPGLDATPLMPVEATPMLSPALAATVALSSPADLARLPLLPHDDWPRWFREVDAGEPVLRFHGGQYPTHELDALAAIEGVGVALLSPTLFRALIDEGKLLQPFAHVLSGPNQHYLLMRPQEKRATVLGFASWLRSEADSRICMST
jgi:LysR family transcriptional regulator, glycine cleavage system transcriptional activator